VNFDMDLMSLVYKDHRKLILLNSMSEVYLNKSKYKEISNKQEYKFRMLFNINKSQISPSGGKF
jgi:hypothetical protein